MCSTPCVHEGTSKNLFESLTEMCLYMHYKTCAVVNNDPMGQPLKKLV